MAAPPHEPLTGIEIGRGGFAIRGMAPILAADGSLSRIGGGALDL